MNAAPAKRFRIRALTAGVPLTRPTEPGPLIEAVDFLDGARRAAIALGFEVQTIRIALNAQFCDLSPAARADVLPAIIALDTLAAERGATLGLGPIFANAPWDPGIAAWAVELARATQASFFSVAVASRERGVQRDAVRAAGEIIAALANAPADGMANFRFAAIACIAPGSPFFPAGYHEGPPSLSIGLESAQLVSDAFATATDPADGTERLRRLLNQEFAPVEAFGVAAAAAGGRRYGGLDVSPAPGPGCSVVGGLEALSRQAFGGAATLQACAAVTAALRSLDVTTCGYSGLMLPVLEDAVLAARAAEGRLRLSQLLLFSSVCGTGLDVVPVPGDSLPAALSRVIGDVATLATRLGKPLSARLLPIPGKCAGEPAVLADPRLCASLVLPLDG